uniref:Uncharacterized protein n=1 Tax=Arundo donax TaxID=35708 RepID=A0A0A9GQ00_ARUDO
MHRKVQVYLLHINNASITILIRYLLLFYICLLYVIYQYRS